MSIVDATASRPRSGRRFERGYTMLEVTITMVVIVLMALVIERTLASTRESDAYLSAIHRAKERCERAMYEVYGTASSSRRIFENDAVGEAYLDALTLDRFIMVPDARLPRFDTDNPLGADRSGDPRTGNVLLLVRESDPLICPGAGEDLYYIDLYRFVCVYPHETMRRVISDGRNYARDLIIWYSLGYPSHAQLLAIADEDERMAAVRSLYSDQGCDYAWDATASVDEAFYLLDAAGHIAAEPTPQFRIREHEDLSAGGVLVHVNTQLAPTRSDRRPRRAIFTADTEGGWKPNGFEVKVTGISGRRKVWLHLVIEAEATKGKGAVHQSTMIASARDL